MSRPKFKSQEVVKIWGKLPKKLRVGAQTCLVKVTEFPEDKRLWGEYDCDEHTIRISCSHPTVERVVETVVHELLHAIWSCWHIGPEAKEEDAVKLLSVGLICLFRDNPKLLLWLQSGV